MNLGTRCNWSQNGWERTARAHIKGRKKRIKGSLHSSGRQDIGRTNYLVALQSCQSIIAEKAIITDEAIVTDAASDIITRAMTRAVNTWNTFC
jgi:arginyl-tRNA--protein-N-Asp/Glu arginylyltransferase